MTHGNRVVDCHSGCRGFEPYQQPHFLKIAIMARRIIHESRTASIRESYAFWKATRARKLVDYEKLKAIANEEISRTPECAGYEVGIVAHLPDETGCNWDIKVTRKGDKRAAPRVREAMLPLRARYNLRADRG
jgi:hypothetical protein